MSEQKKQERDYTPEVDALLSEVDVLVKVTSFDFNSISCNGSIAQAGKLQDGLDKLFVLEKATRNVSLIVV
jgi:26S proteasome regulatory subunit N5